jgi:hypothetical protein
MDTSLLISLLLGLPAAVLASLRIIDRWKKRKASRLKVAESQHKSTLPEASANEDLAPIISQAELIAEVEKQIAEELRAFEANHRR